MSEVPPAFFILFQRNITLRYAEKESQITDLSSENKDMSIFVT